MGSHPPRLAVAPQHELPPEVTRSAASPYFCLTTSLIPTVSVALIGSLLFADLNNVSRLQRLISGAALGIKKLQQFLQSRRVGRVAKKGSLALHFHQPFRPQFVQMMGEGR